MKTSENKSGTTQRLRGEGNEAKEKVKEKKTQEKNVSIREK